ncbi:MAG: DUF371 domain-containing protein [archaeon]
MILTARGHSNIQATHKTTIEVTKESDLTLQGDCIIGVSATAACSDLPEDLKQKLKTDCEVQIILKVDGLVEIIKARGSPNLILTNTQDIVIRKSDFIDDRTLCINADKACADLNREFVEKLKNSKNELTMEITYENA